MLASWLFAQYLLTNDVQIAYSQTEGYVPVTAKAQQSAAYQDYLAQEGADDTLHYDVKIKASKLLLDNVDNTFTTPVYNGSASLRNAAGQLIEDVTKSVRRKEPVDAAYMVKLYDSVTSLYRLDQRGAMAADGSQALGPLPAPAKALLFTLGGVWVLMAVYGGVQLVKKKNRQNSH